MDQISFLDAEYNHKKKKTRREIFLESMEQVVPWKRLEKRIKKHYSSATTGRPAYPLSSMLRIHCMQHWYNMSDPAMEDALYEIHSMRKFADLSLERIPDESTILNFRHLLEKHKLGEKIFKEISSAARQGHLIQWV
ncbi:MAG: transposase [Thiotrichales bacterium]|jgi:transposase, IS5 family|nr:transposase [Thiotrichales bacterium]